jgi:nitric oxide reductase subunit B
MERLVWMRVPGDILFAAGALFLAAFALQYWLGGRAAARERGLAVTKASAPAG